MGVKLSFEDTLRAVQKKLATDHKELLNRDNVGKELLLSYISNYLYEMNVEVDGYDENELAESLYYEMAEFSFLSKYFERDDIEEININAWDDTKIHYSSGKIQRSKEQFRSPIHAVDIIRRLLSKSNMVLDAADPITVGHLSKRIRITAMLEGVIDKGLGVAVSIRIVNAKKLSKRDLVMGGTATNEMIKDLSEFYKHGASVCLTGETGSGKTTIMSCILDDLPHDKRVITLEQDTREFELIKKTADGVTLNNVVHLTTRTGKGDTQNIDMTKLLETALTINPDYLVVAEMKSTEAVLAISAANTGHAVMTTIHSGSCFDTYNRMLILSKQKYDISENMVLKLAARAFPITVFCKKLSDGVRRIMEIAECLGISENGEPIMNTLYKYKIHGESTDEYGMPVVNGEFVKENEISERLCIFLKENGYKSAVTEV